MREFKVSFKGSDYPAFYVTDAGEADIALSKLSSKSGIIACDLETMALPEYKHVPDAALSPFMARPRLLQVFTGKAVLVLDLLKVEKVDIARLFEARPAVWHNVTFDYKMLNRHHGVSSPDFHCTMIMAMCVFHAIYPQDHVSASLESVVKAFLDTEILKGGGATDWSMPDLTYEQLHYASLDVVVLLHLYVKLTNLLNNLGLSKVYELYRKSRIVLSDIELHGIGIDLQKHRFNVIKWREELSDAKDDVCQMTGLKEITDAKLGEWLSKTLSPDVLAIWPRTGEDGTGDPEKKNRLSVSADTLIDFSHLDIVKPFSKFQKLKKLTTSFGMSLIEKVNPQDNRLHCSYKVAGAKTGRLSCSNPNIQQAPRSREFRSIFTPTLGKVLVRADYSQVEVRCIAEMSNDSRMLDVYQKGLDIYKYTAAHVNHKRLEDVKPEERQAAKALVLGLNYGLGAKKFGHYAKKGYGVEVSEEESHDLVKKYRQLYSGLTQWQKRQVQMCEARHYTAYTVMGKSRKMYEDSYYGACMNHPVQGSCAEIMLIALYRCSKKLTNAKLLASVHDEILVECNPVDVEEVKTILTEEMTNAYLDILPSGRTIKGLIEPTHGYNWAEAK